MVRALRVGLWHSVPTALLVPLASAFGGARVPAQVMMFVAMFNKAISGTNAFTGCLVRLAAAGACGSRMY